MISKLTKLPLQLWPLSDEDLNELRENVNNEYEKRQEARREMINTEQLKKTEELRQKSYGLYTDKEWGDILFDKELQLRKISDSMVDQGIDVVGDEKD